MNKLTKEELLEIEKEIADARKGKYSYLDEEIDFSRVDDPKNAKMPKPPQKKNDLN